MTAPGAGYVRAGGRLADTDADTDADADAGTEALRDSLRRLAPLPDAALDALVGCTDVRRFDRGAWLLRGGEPARWCFFVTAGLVRELYVGTDGVEHTRAFVAEGQATGSLLDLLSGGPSVTWIEALEPTTALAWSWQDQEALCDRFPALHQLMRRVAEDLYVRKARREHEMLALTAGERYRRWLAAAPALDARVQRRHVASYLGISAEHLSRLRRTPTR